MLTKKLISEPLQKAGVTLNGSKPYDIRVYDERLYKWLMLEPSLAAGEGYMQKWWDCDQLDEFFFRLWRNNQNTNFYNTWADTFRRFTNILFNRQSRKRSLNVAEKHYNLGKDLYTSMLGKSMAYTCGYWKNAKTLDQAQVDKYDLVCRKINLKKGDRVLELGSGWGTFAKFAAENYGAKISAVNISIEQVRYAQEINKGLPVELYLCDYRDVNVYNPKKKPFDKVVSIGLCEHVGLHNYRKFMKIALDNLEESGLFLLHTIGRNNSAYFVDPWINKYIFPNGMLPSLKQLTEAMENLFVLEDLHNFGPDYDKTLMAWHRNFVEHWPQLQHHYDETFYRMWNFYLLSCAGGFRARGMQLWQMVLSPKGVFGGYESVR